MPRWALVGALLLAVAAGAPGSAPGSPSTAAVGAPCKRAPLARCLTVAVPLDRSGHVPGKVSLHVEVLPAAGRQRGVVFLLAGGPGQAATQLFDFHEPLIGVLFRTAFPGYTLVAYDVRGTGRSGALHCPLGAKGPDDEHGVASCARALGARRDLYGTPDQAQDLDAVRQALGYDSIALAAVSYGTELAVEYARAFPTHVDRLLLDSVALLDRPDPLAAHVLSNVPATLKRFCAGGACRSATPDFAADVAALARKLEAHPLRGAVPRTAGGTRTVQLGKFGFVSLVLDADLNPGLALELPAATHAALDGNAAPLVRLAHLDPVSDSAKVGLNNAVFLATACRDARFPWRADTPVSRRRGVYDAAVAALSPGALGGFGSWAAQFGSAFSCLEWPSPAGGAARSTAPLPDVPVLVLSGALDMRTPTVDGAALARRFPHARLLVVPRVGHSVLTNDLSGCALLAVRNWINGDAVGARCPRVAPPFAAVPAYAPAGAPTPGAAGTFALTRATVDEAIAAWLMTAAIGGESTTVAGLTHGKAANSLTGITLTEYGIEPGVWLTGRLSLSVLPPIHFSGTVTVSGPRAVGGKVTVEGAALDGVLGGKSVGS